MMRHARSSASRVASSSGIGAPCIGGAETNTRASRRELPAASCRLTRHDLDEGLLDVDGTAGTERPLAFEDLDRRHPVAVRELRELEGQLPRAWPRRRILLEAARDEARERRRDVGP